MPEEENERDAHFSGSGSTGPGKAIDPKDAETDCPMPAPRAVPIGVPISATEYKKLKERAKTGS
jgi:hypothetical protein